MNATVNVVLFRSKTLSNGKHPLMIRVCKDNKKKYKSIGIALEAKYWDETKGVPRRHCPDIDHIKQIISEKLAEYQTQVLEFKTSQKNFTASTLIKNAEQVTAIKTVDEFYTELITHYKSIGKVGNSNIYRDSYNSIKTFKKSDKLDFLFVEIDPAWLNEYEKWMISIGKAETTMHLLFRTLRSSFNKAIEQNLVRKEDYPFTSFKMSKFNTKTKKRAITKEEIKRILDLDLSNERELIRLSRDLFIFSYLQGGINLTDIAHLKYENIASGRMEYIRQKTKGLINVPLQDEALKIIQIYSNSDANSSDYIFPILNRKVHITAIQKYNRIHKIIGKINPNLKLIAQKAKIESNLTTYVARHNPFSFSLKINQLQEIVIEQVTI